MDSDAITDFDREIEESLKRVDQENAAMRRDAERYRWIKSQGLLKVAAMTSLHPGESRIYGDFTYRVPGTFGELGTAIDAAMKGANDK